MSLLSGGLVDGGSVLYGGSGGSDSVSGIVGGVSGGIPPGFHDDDFAGGDVGILGGSPHRVRSGGGGGGGGGGDSAQGSEQVVGSVGGLPPVDMGSLHHDIAGGVPSDPFGDGLVDGAGHGMMSLGGDLFGAGGALDGLDGLDGAGIGLDHSSMLGGVSHSCSRWWISRTVVV